MATCSKGAFQGPAAPLATAAVGTAPAQAGITIIGASRAVSCAARSLLGRGIATSFVGISAASFTSCTTMAAALRMATPLGPPSF